MAKIYIVHDHEGKILAASTFKDPPRPAHHRDKITAAAGAKIPPETMLESVTISEFEVPAKFSNKKLHEYIPLLRVDVAARRLQEK